MANRKEVESAIQEGARIHRENCKDKEFDITTLLLSKKKDGKNVDVLVFSAVMPDTQPPNNTPTKKQIAVEFSYEEARFFVSNLIEQLSTMQKNEIKNTNQ